MYHIFFNFAIGKQKISQLLNPVIQLSEPQLLSCILVPAQTLNFLKNEEFQNRINADIREVSDELYKYDDTPETISPNMPQYRKNSKGLDLYPYICNGYMYLRFFYNHEYNHAATLVYDIIEEKRIEQIEELLSILNEQKEISVSMN